MFSDCPRCEKAQLTSYGSCPNCGYTLRTSCRNCGSKNAPIAKFCGSCGNPLTFFGTVKHWFNMNISYVQKFKLRKVFAGFAFGIFLAFFAFGSMGMGVVQNNSLPNDQNIYSKGTESYISLRTIRKLDRWEMFHDKSKNANLRNLISVSNIILANLSPALSNSSNSIAKTADEYLEDVKNSQVTQNSILNRGTVANFLFLLTSDLLNLSYKDFPGKHTYIDIPRFNYLNIPTEALEMLGVKICKSKNELGITSKVTIGEICNMARAIVIAAEVKTKLGIFKTLPPAI